MLLWPPCLLHFSSSPPISPVDVDQHRALRIWDVRRHAWVRQHPVDEPESSELDERRRVDEGDRGIHGLVGGGGVLEHAVGGEQVSVCFLQLLELLPLHRHLSFLRHELHILSLISWFAKDGVWVDGFGARCLMFLTSDDIEMLFDDLICILMQIFYMLILCSFFSIAAHAGSGLPNHFLQLRLAMDHILQSILIRLVRFESMAAEVIFVNFSPFWNELLGIW